MFPSLLGRPVGIHIAESFYTEAKCFCLDSTQITQRISLDLPSNKQSFEPAFQNDMHYCKLVIYVTFCKLPPLCV